jgi:sugar phosphate isomerase/epimerase
VSEDEIAALAAAGMGGLEVDHPDHDPATRAALRELAASLGLLVTGSSDFHGDHKEGLELGANTTDPQQLAALLDQVTGCPLLGHGSSADAANVFRDPRVPGVGPVDR